MLEVFLHRRFPGMGAALQGDGDELRVLAQFELRAYQDYSL